VKLSVLLVDDHLLFRAGVKSVLKKQPEIKAVLEASGFDDALQLFERRLPDVVILDLRMPGRGGFEVMQAMQNIQSDARVLVLSSFANEEEIYRAMTLGSKGYLLKDTGSAELMNAIREIASGRTYFPASITAIASNRSSKTDLTSRELEVLALMVKGLTNREIATVLGTSQNTIRNQTVSIFAKLEVTDRTEAVSTALQRGIVIP
jgi:two-component system, NarL family, response regulator